MINQVWISLVLAAFLSPSCGNGKVVGNQTVDRIPNGTWGGQHMRMEVEDSSATIEYDCGHGTIDSVLRVDHKGGFSLAGTFAREHGGPIRRDEKDNSQPATYAGRMDGTRMDITVTLTDTKEKIGTFVLTFKDPGRIWKCR